MIVAYTNFIAYIVLAAIVGNLTTIVILVAFIMFLAREDGKGLHDLIANTQVVKVDYDINKQFVEKTSQMGDWAEVVDEDDDGFGEIKKDDEW